MNWRVFVSGMISGASLVIAGIFLWHQQPYGILVLGLVAVGFMIAARE